MVRFAGWNSALQPHSQRWWSRWRCSHFYLRSGSARVMPFKVSAPGEWERERLPSAFSISARDERHNGPENKQKHAGAHVWELRNFVSQARGEISHLEELNASARTYNLHWRRRPEWEAGKRRVALRAATRRGPGPQLANCCCRANVY